MKLGKVEALLKDGGGNGGGKELVLFSTSTLKG